MATGQNKVAQHLEGGLIQELMVAEGDRVSRGQPLVALDGTLARANKRELFLRQLRLEATAVRLLAAYHGADALVFPNRLEAHADDPEVATILDEQRLAFVTRRGSLEKDIALLERNIDALDLRARLRSPARRLSRPGRDLRRGARRQGAPLRQGPPRKSEMNALKRAMVEATGHIGRLEAEIAEIDQMRLNCEVQMEKTRSQYRQTALDELQLIQSELESVREAARKAEDVLARSVVEAPVAGTVYRLHYHTPGGVIESGKAILEILPSEAPLIIEANVPRTEIDTVRPGQEATVRLTALNQRTTPVLEGEVFYVSADAIADTSAGPIEGVYVARIALPADQLARVPGGFTPTPGMPVE
ncbi:MAG: HlyD family type I secretion periplasmic adaptor subunit, partial [Alphaproteobacteria bacterium]